MTQKSSDYDVLKTGSSLYFLTNYLEAEISSGVKTKLTPCFEISRTFVFKNFLIASEVISDSNSKETLFLFASNSSLTALISALSFATQGSSGSFSF